MGKPRNHICDVPGCGNRRGRGHRLCQRCFDLLPAIVSRGLNIAFRNGDRTLWKARREEAGGYLARSMAAGIRGAIRPPAVNPTSVATYNQRLERMLGERPDA